MYRCLGFLIAGVALILGGWVLLLGRNVGQANEPNTQQTRSPKTTDAPRAVRPNILIIMPDDVGFWNVGAYSHGMMVPTPNIDRIAKEGMLFTDHYSQPTCTPGRAALITGQLPIRTGLTTVGMAGSPIGLDKRDPTLAETGL